MILGDDWFGLKWNRNKNWYRLGNLAHIKSRFKRGSQNWFTNGVQTKELMFAHFPHQWSVIIRYWWFNFTMHRYRIQCWFQNREKNLVKILESLLNQKVKGNYQLDVQDHFQAQVQFREKDNLPKCQEVGVVWWN